MLHLLTFIQNSSTYFYTAMHKFGDPKTIKDKMYLADKLYFTSQFCKVKLI